MVDYSPANDPWMQHFKGMFKAVRRYMIKQAGIPTDGRTAFPHSDDKDVARVFDLMAECLAINYCSRNRLNVIVVGEESGSVHVPKYDTLVDLSSRTPDYILLMDAVDGSENWRNGILGTCFSVAAIPYTSSTDLINPCEAEMYFVGEFNTGNMWMARKGEGNFYKGLFSGNKYERTRTSRITNLNEAILEIDPDFATDLTRSDVDLSEKVSVRRIFPLIENDRRTRRNGSATLGLVQVSTGGKYPDGGISGYVDVRGISKPGNWVGPFLGIREAGGICTDLNGNEIREIDPERSYDYVASANQQLHEQILQAIDI
jgi:fructose-1,6-bisphosphatase/inositol monophosphatase family enzyme